MKASDNRVMFASIARKYDVLNDVLSLGIHRRWRRTTARKSAPRSGMRILDLAAGTCDLALEFKKHCPECKVLATDFCEEILEVGMEKADKRNVAMEFDIADATKLFYEDNEFDIASIAFGIRNTENPGVAISEMSRVVKPGGIVVVLEFGKPDDIVLPVYRIFAKYIFPAAGRLIAGSAGAYSYLYESSMSFPCREEFAEMMRQNGNFVSVEWKPLSMGIAYLYTGIRT